MKNFWPWALILFPLLLSPSLRAAQGLVIVLNAPIYQGPNTKEKVVDYVRQGMKIFVFDEDIGPEAIMPEQGQDNQNPDQDVDTYIDEEVTSDPLNIEKDERIYAPQDFYRTWDKLGRVAYIPKRYLKIIFNDDREAGQPITLPSDETDYRLDDILSPDYPFHRSHQHQFVVSFRTGRPVSQHYAYPSLVVQRKSTWRQGMQTHWGKVLPFELGYRRYFGLRLSYWGQSASYLLANNIHAKESMSLIGLGPYFSYTPFRRDRYNLEIQFSINLHLARSFIHQTYQNDFEDRSFVGLPASTAFSIQWSMTDLLPWLDVVLAMEGEYYFAAHLKQTNSRAISEWWESSPHHHHLSAHGQWAILIGLGDTF